MANVLRGLAFGLQELGRQTQGAKKLSIEEEDRRLDEEDRKRRRDREDRDLARRDRLDALDEREFNRSMELLGLQLEAAKDAREQVKLAGTPEERQERTQELERLELDIQRETLKASQAQTALLNAQRQGLPAQRDREARDRRIKEREQVIKAAEKNVEIVQRQQDEAREKLFELQDRFDMDDPTNIAGAERQLGIINRTEAQLQTLNEELETAGGIVLPETPTLEDLPIELTDQGQGEPEPGGGILGAIKGLVSGGLGSGVAAVPSIFPGLLPSRSEQDTQQRSIIDIGAGAGAGAPPAGLGEQILNPRELLPDIPGITSFSTIDPFSLRRR